MPRAPLVSRGAFCCCVLSVLRQLPPRRVTFLLISPSATTALTHALEQAMRFFNELKRKEGGKPIQIDFGAFCLRVTWNHGRDLNHLCRRCMGVSPLSLRTSALPAPPTAHRPLRAGCWIAPTALFAATYADKVYALEPDMAAYREAHHNIELNAAASAKIDKRQMCISDKAGQLTMYGLPGDSMSSSLPARDPSARPGYTSWTVECNTLDAFIEAEGINIDDIALIKIDTEGHEAPVLAQMRPWFKAHPGVVISLSVHSFMYPDLANAEHVKMQQQVHDVVLDFKYVMTNEGVPIDRAGFNVGVHCYLCGLILTNNEPPAGFADWKAALSSQ